MAGKNDVELIVRAKDATGPGLDSARDRLRKFGSDTGRITDQAIKFGAAVQGLQGAFSVATAAVALFRGDTDQVLESLKRLPLGLGSVVSGLETFVNYVTGAADEIARLKQNSDRINESIAEGFRADTARRSLAERAKLETAPDDFARQRQQALQERLGMRASLGSNLRPEDDANIDKITQARLDKIEAAREKAAYREILAERKKQEELAKVREKAADDEATYRERVLARRFSGIGGAGLFADEREGAQMRADEQALRAAMDRARGGGAAAGLPSGEQSRFLTGLAASGRESQARAAQQTADATKKTVEKLEQLVEIMKDAAQPANPATQLNLTVGVFGGAA